MSSLPLCCTWYLFFYRCDVNLADDIGCTPLHYAVLSNSPDIITILLSNGADTRIRDKTKMTPLQYSREKVFIFALTIHPSVYPIIHPSIYSSIHLESKGLYSCSIIKTKLIAVKCCTCVIKKHFINLFSFLLTHTHIKS